MIYVLKCQFHDLVVIYQGNITTGNEIVGQWPTTGLRPAVSIVMQHRYTIHTLLKNQNWFSALTVPEMTFQARNTLNIHEY